MVVDLTTHYPGKLVAFFRDEHCDKLFNVAISRAKDRLLVIGSRAMLRELGGRCRSGGGSWASSGSGIEPLPCDDLLGRPRQLSRTCPAIPRDRGQGPARHLLATIRHVGPATARRRRAEEAGGEPQAARVDGRADDRRRATSSSAPARTARRSSSAAGRLRPATGAVAGGELPERDSGGVADRLLAPGRRGGGPGPGEAVLLPGVLERRPGAAPARGRGGSWSAPTPRSTRAHHRKRLSLEDAKLKVRLQRHDVPARSTR